ncbi:MAG: glycosyltransferase [Phycisphaerales bacterium]|nr:glycosyltransferase [Phycisphaerales bacterium]
MLLSFILPTRNRHNDLARTLDLLASCTTVPALDAEVVVIDNASTPAVRVPDRLRNGWPVHLESLDANHGTAARNIGSHRANGTWLIMLDDDSTPIDFEWVDQLRTVPKNCAVIASPVVLSVDGPAPRREAGGLPCVFIGCGAAIRREVFETLGGYDATFGYYAEEYDFCAKLLMHGYAVRWSMDFIVHHRKVAANRNMNVILENLVVNNARVIDRYAPSSWRDAERERLVKRCRAIADREHAQEGFERGLARINPLPPDVRTQLTVAEWSRFTGAAHARESLRDAYELAPFRSARLIDPTHIAGKHRWCIDAALRSLGIAIVDDDAADVDVIATLSPGPMLDTAELHAATHPDRRIITPWMPAATMTV